jgi:hypothetical protein
VAEGVGDEQSAGNPQLLTATDLSREPRKLPSNGAFRHHRRRLRLVPLPVFKLCLLRDALYRLAQEMVAGSGTHVDRISGVEESSHSTL